MDLGKANLRRTGVNILYNAVHTKYGLAWTDGRGVYLTPVRIKDERIQREDSLKLGEFECIQSLHWSCEYPGSVCYLCLVHETTVTLWKVSGAAPDLHLKQVRKINATPVPQGVLWSPTRDILCILNRDRANFYFKHCQNKGSYALPPIDSGKITCGCWSLDGNKLLMGIGSIVLIYQWEDIAKSVSDYTLIAWKIPSVEGRLTTLTALSNTWMVGSVDLPLESMCMSNNSDLFRVPESSDFPDHKSKLFNLQHNAVSGSRAAQLVMFEVPYSQKEPRKIAGAPLRTVTSPDLIHYNSGLRRITVGSNTQSVLQVFQLTDTQLWKIQDIRLDKAERPKGLCGVATRGSTVPPEGVLVMVGSSENTDSAFLPSSSRATFRLSFTFHPFRNPDLAVLERLVNMAGGDCMNAVSLDSYASDSILRELQLPSSNTKVHLLRINPLRQESSHSDPGDCQDASKSHRPLPSPPNTAKRNMASNTDNRKLLLPRSASVDHSRRHPEKVFVVSADGEESDSELEVEGVSFEDNLPNFVNSLEKLTDPTPLNLLNGQESGGSARGRSHSDSQGHWESRSHGDGYSPSDSCRVVSDSLSHYDSRSQRERQGRYENQSQYNSQGRNGSQGHTDKIRPFIVTNGSWKIKSQDSPSDASVSSDTSNSNLASGEPRMQRRASLESDPLSARDRISSELPQQVASLETQISSQGMQIMRLGDRIDYVSRLLEETSLVAANQYQPLSSPELLRVVLEPEHENEASVTKTFVLDNCRLQLEPIKQTFGLLTVEILIDGEPSVVGSNVDGYLPIKFHPNDMIHITGRRATDVFSPSAFVSSTI